MKTKDYKGLYVGQDTEQFDKFLYCESSLGTEVFDTLDTSYNRWISWQYDRFRSEDPSEYPEEIVLPVEFLT